jgi:hypothetical protein
MAQSIVGPFLQAPWLDSSASPTMHARGRLRWQVERFRRGSYVIQGGLHFSSSSTRRRRGGHGEIACSSVNILPECWCCSLSSLAPLWQVPKRRLISIRTARTPIGTRTARILPSRLADIMPRHLQGTATTIRGPGIPGTDTTKRQLHSLRRSVAPRTGGAAAPPSNGRAQADFNRLRGLRQ